LGVDKWILQQKMRPSVEKNGQKHFFFNSTSYLSIDQFPAYEEILIECIRRYGFSHGLSRVNNLQLSIFEEFEAYFAHQARAESAAVFSSGYLAGTAAWKALRYQADICWIAPDTHPAILPEDAVLSPAESFDAWKNQCLAAAEKLSPQKILILGNAVDPLKAQIHEYNWLAPIAQKHELTLLIDDSHAFGVLGKSIYGTYSQYQIPRLNLVISGSLGKGLAMPAGIILGSARLIEQVKSTSIFRGASPPAPANLQAFLETENIYLEAGKLIRSFSSMFFEQTQSIEGIAGSADFPVFRYQETHWADRLQEMGFITSSFAYPHLDSPKINRIVLSAGHEMEDLELLNQALHLLSEKK
jgi:7-keto-8-aminopelargonate synthetase-like enzyme